MKPPLMNILAAMTLATMPASAVVYSGSLTSDLGLTGTGAWETGASISWNIENIGVTTLNNEEVVLWNYSYTLDVTAKDISHTIIEVSDVFTELNILGGVQSVTALEGFELNNYTSVDQGGSNPGMPGSIHGIKVDVASDTTSLTWSFNSNIGPVWGDFYAKDGKDTQGTVEVYLYNTGFAADDPTTPVDPNAEGYVDVLDHIVVPDSAATTPPDEEGPGIIPEPTTAMLGALGLLLILRRRKN